MLKAGTATVHKFSKENSGKTHVNSGHEVTNAVFPARLSPLPCEYYVDPRPTCILDYQTLEFFFCKSRLLLFMNVVR